MREWTLLDKHADDEVVAFGDAGTRTRADLAGAALCVAAALPEPTLDSHVLLVFKNDRFAFAAALLGAWARGHAVALPPNTRRESVWVVQERPECVCTLHDTDVGAPIRIDSLIRDARPAAGTRFATPPARDVATVFTSGTTGDVTAWSKSSAQLLGEADVLAAAFGLGNTRIAATVPPGHIYGLLYSVLVPLRHGGAFLRESPLHAESVADRVATHAADVLVTVPAHLRGLGRVEAGRLASIQRVISSTAPLPDETASAFVAQHGVDVTEVLGSSETGGIAWRTRSTGASWSPLPEVDVGVNADGRLVVGSPFVHAAVSRPFVSEDLATINDDGTFEHRGRVDGIVKVGGLRVSLPAMQAAISAIDGVDDAAVTSVDDESGRGQAVLAAVVGAGVDAERIRDVLLERFEPSTLPRRLVFVDALPREENGKLPRGRLLSLFGLDAAGRTIRWGLDWRDEERGEHTLCCRVHVPPSYGWYEGHFPGYPIMAGAVQLTQLVRPAIERALPAAGRIAGLSRLKFQDRILPGDVIDVVLDWSEDGTTFDFRIVRDETTCASGRVELEPSADENPPLF